MAKELCKVCNKEFANLTVHLRTKHDLTRKQYELNEYDIEDLLKEETSQEINPEETVSKEIEETEISELNDSVTNDEITKTLFGEQERIYLDEFCQQNNITEKELRNIVKQYKGTAVVPASQVIQERTNQGITEADRLVKNWSEGEEIKVTSVFIAETLINKYSFTCKTVKSGNPKTWILVK